MTDTPNPATLPVVAWQAEDDGRSFISQMAWENNSFYLSKYTIALTPHAPAQAAIDELRAEVERLRKDAGLYRALRLQHWTDGDEALVVARAKSLRPGIQTFSAHLLDDALAAMSSLPGEGEKT